MYHSCRSGTVLLSRQALRPCGRCQWVKQSVQAVKWLKDRNLTLITSVGMPTWELVTGLGSIYALNLEILLPAADSDTFETLKSELSVQFNLNDQRTTFVPVYSSQDGIDIRQKRDREIIERSHVILPVSVRRGGHMDRLIHEFERAGKKVIRQFAVEYEPRDVPLAYEIQPRSLNPDLARLNNSYLIHWTRTANGAWPDETSLDYYRAVIQSDSYPRSAFDTLNNILSTATIRASSTHMPGKTAAISFSNCPPEAMTRLMTWRARYRVMSFEPYGIGIEKQAALKMNILPVKYYDPDNSAAVDGKHWLSQSRGRKSDWSTEDEYRHLGDLDLSGMDENKLIVLCRTMSEAQIITARTGLSVIPFTIE